MTKYAIGYFSLNPNQTSYAVILHDADEVFDNLKDAKEALAKVAQEEALSLMRNRIKTIPHKPYTIFEIKPPKNKDVDFDSMVAEASNTVKKQHEEFLRLKEIFGA